MSQGGLLIMFGIKLGTVHKINFKNCNCHFWLNVLSSTSQLHFNLILDPPKYPQNILRKTKIVRSNVKCSQKVLQVKKVNEVGIECGESIVLLDEAMG